MSFILTPRDRQRLVGVHKDLVAVVERCAGISPCGFVVLEGLRTVERQKQLVAQGASWTMKSRHLTGHAVDLAPYLDTDGDGDKEISWHWPHFWPLVEAMEDAASQLGIALEAGARWTKTPDGPHYQLSWKKYP